MEPEATEFETDNAESTAKTKGKIGKTKINLGIKKVGGRIQKKSVSSTYTPTAAAAMALDNIQTIYTKPICTTQSNTNELQQQMNILQSNTLQHDQGPFNISEQADAAQQCNAFNLNFLQQYTDNQQPDFFQSNVQQPIVVKQPNATGQPLVVPRPNTVQQHIVLQQANAVPQANAVQQANVLQQAHAVQDRKSVV